MSKIRKYIAIIALFCSWILLYWLTGSRTPWYQQSFYDTADSVEIFLGDIPTQNYDRMGFTKAVVAYSEKETGWIVGTERGELFLFDNEGHQKWKRSLGIGKLISLCISNDGEKAFIGETSPEGNLYAIDVHTGDILWQYKAVDFIGADSSKRSHPSVVHIAVDKNNNIYANTYRFLMLPNGIRSYKGKMLAISEQGKLLWNFPAKEAMDSWINWCDVNDNNGRVVISTSAYDIQDNMQYKDTMYFLDKNTGTLLNSVFIPPVEPFDNTVMRGSPNFSQDGNFLAAACSDGRGFLFDKQGEIIWSRTISKPIQVDKSWLNASGRDGYVTSHGVLFTTINTFNRENWQLPTPVEHPGNNSIFVFNLDGTYRYQYRNDATVEQIVFADKLAICAVGRNVRTHNYDAHGVLVIDLEKGSKKQFFHTQGPLQAVAVSKNGSLIAGVEAPAVTKQGKIIGAHRLHIWKNSGIY